MLAPSVAAPGAMKPESAMNQKTFNIWVCDVCSSAKFHDYHEACRHEEACMNQKRKSARKQEPVKKQASTTATDTPSEYEQPNRHEPPKNYEPPQKPSILKTTKPIHSFFVPGLAKEFKSCSNAAEAVVCDSSSGEESARKRKGPKPFFTAKMDPTHSAADDMKGAAKRQRKDIYASVSSKKTASLEVVMSVKNNFGEEIKKPAVLAAIFGAKSEHEILKEQRAVELAAKRHLERREKSRARADKPKTAPAEHRSKQPIPERFPILSHVGVIQGEPSNLVTIYSEALSVLRKTSKHPSGCGQLPDDLTECCHLGGPAIDVVTDSTLKVLSSALVAPSVLDLQNSSLWSNKYRIQNIPHDVCGDANKTVAAQCVGFVDEWKLERLKAHKRRADKQEKLAKGRHKRGSKKKPDDIWDDASDDDQACLPSVCLLTGPVGCGKTNLVHAVARHCACNVMEINTTDKRSSQNLKNAIEEVTQSDSTLDLLNNNVATPQGFVKKFEPLVDTDDEDDEKGGSAVAVILIDEVDLIFEDDGDSGFWTALKALSKRAKCPIFLTANIIPQAVSALSMRLTHFSMERPTPGECVNKLWQVIKSESIARIQSISCDQAKRTLSSFAELHQCDVRRMILDLQLFALSSRRIIASNTYLQRPDALSNTLRNEVSGTTLDVLEVEPVVTKITPNAVPSQEKTLLAIEGKNFMSLAQSCRVSLGDQICEAKVVSDSMILAVCPPFHYLENHHAEILCKSSGKTCYSRRYPLVTIETESMVPCFMLGKRFQTRELCNGSKIPIFSHFSIEYLIPPQSIKERTKDDILPDDLDDRLQGVLVFSKGEVVRPEATTERARIEITEAEKTLKYVDCMDPPTRGNTAEDRLSYDEFISLAKKVECRSDALLMEDSRYGLPCLAGASRGFASLYVDGFETSPSTDANRLGKNSQTKPPSLERILYHGWNEDACFYGNSDAFVTNPSLRDRQCYSRAARLSRHCTFPSGAQSKDDQDNDQFEQDDSNASYFPSNPDDDSFLVRETLLTEIAPLMTHLLAASTFQDHVLNEVNSKRRKDTVRATNAFFGQLWHEANLRDIFARGLVRQVDTDEPIDERLFLDYGPLLSIICAYEVAAISLSEAAEGGVQPYSKRSTRRSKTVVYTHYFRSVNQNLNDETCREIGQERAKCLLQF